jgi:hypothetical protein
MSFGEFSSGDETSPTQQHLLLTVDDFRTWFSSAADNQQQEHHSGGRLATAAVGRLQRRDSLPSTVGPLSNLSFADSLASSHLLARSRTAWVKPTLSAAELQPSSTLAKVKSTSMNHRRDAFTSAAYFQMMDSSDESGDADDINTKEQKSDGANEGGKSRVAQRLEMLLHRAHDGSTASPTIPQHVISFDASVDMQRPPRASYQPLSPLAQVSHDFRQSLRRPLPGPNVVLAGGTSGGATVGGSAMVDNGDRRSRLADVIRKQRRSGVAGSGDGLTRHYRNAFGIPVDSRAVEATRTMRQSRAASPFKPHDAPPSSAHPHTAPLHQQQNPSVMPTPAPYELDHVASRSRTTPMNRAGTGAPPQQLLWDGADDDASSDGFGEAAYSMDFSAPVQPHSTFGLAQPGVHDRLSSSHRLDPGAQLVLLRRHVARLEADLRSTNSHARMGSHGRHRGANGRGKPAGASATTGGANNKRGSRKDSLVRSMLVS